MASQYPGGSARGPRRRVARVQVRQAAGKAGQTPSKSGSRSYGCLARASERCGGVFESHGRRSGSPGRGLDRVALRSGDVAGRSSRVARRSSGEAGRLSEVSGYPSQVARNSRGSPQFIPDPVLVITQSSSSATNGLIETCLTILPFAVNDTDVVRLGTLRLTTAILQSTSDPGRRPGARWAAWPACKRTDHSPIGIRTAHRH